VIHCKDEEVIMAFGIEKPAFRIVVNTWGTMGAIGASTGFAPAMTLAPGGIGGSVVSDNITVKHLMNIKRLGYPIAKPPELALSLAPDVVREGTPPPSDDGGTLDDEAIERIVRKVLSQLYPS
jgi:acetaldehyde dehydrogenase (acetylating)